MQNQKMKRNFCMEQQRWRDSWNRNALLIIKRFMIVFTHSRSVLCMHCSFYWLLFCLPIWFFFYAKQRAAPRYFLFSFYSFWFCGYFITTVFSKILYQMAANAKDNIDGKFFVVLPICVLVVDNGKKLCAAMRKTPTNDCIAERVAFV